VVGFDRERRVEMTKEPGYKAEKEEFKDKAPGSTKGRDAGVDSHLSNMAGKTQDPYGGDPDNVRPKLDDAARKTTKP
jgi:hypothetical protein